MCFFGAQFEFTACLSPRFSRAKFFFGFGASHFLLLLGSGSDYFPLEGLGLKPATRHVVWGLEVTPL